MERGTGRCAGCEGVPAAGRPPGGFRASAAAVVRMPRDPDNMLALRREFLATGIVPADVPLPIMRSWQRSAAHGLRLDAPPRAEAVSRQALREVLERNQFLVEAACGEIESLCRDLELTGGIAVLTDAEGVVLIRAGSPSFAVAADRVALRPGAHWGEGSVGTNAIGTALVEGSALSVVGGEHFLTSNGVLSCSAVPILDPCGAIVGILDVTTEADTPHAYTLPLMRRAVEQIERLLFERACSRQEQMHLHANPYLLGGPHEGLLAFDGDRLVGANRQAVDLLGLSWSAVGAARFDQLFSVQHGSVRRHAASDECVVQTMRGSTLFARMQPPAAAPSRRQEAPPPAAEPAVLRPIHEILDRLLDGRLAGQVAVRRMKAGHLLYGSQEVEEGGELVLVVRAGRLRCFASFEGKELTLFTLDAGDAILLHSETMLEVKRDCEVVVLREATFRRLVLEDPGLGLAVLPAVERMLQKSIRMIEDMAFHGVRHRLVRALCEAAERDGRRTRQGVVIDVAPHGEDLAMEVGATRQSVSTVVAELIRGGVLQRLGNSSMVIPDLDRLKAELEPPP
ncbi:helix-turn-helix domain-containing protein [Azospirillum sp. ST 5-10]|uniref:helix-turn-helix domain-containing protein n=1 Tax=unclassified Azospirillum TaxID=2630922 RepID=UPI003F49DE7F